MWSIGLEAKKTCPASGLMHCSGNICPCAGSWGVWETEQIVLVCACEVPLQNTLYFAPLCLPPSRDTQFLPVKFAQESCCCFRLSMGFQPQMEAFLIIQRTAANCVQSVHQGENCYHRLFKSHSSFWRLSMDAVHPTDCISLLKHLEMQCHRNCPYEK